MTQEEYQELLNSLPIQVQDTNQADLVIADENLNALVTFKNGHIQTANFNSATAKGPSITGKKISDLEEITELNIPEVLISASHNQASGEETTSSQNPYLLIQKAGHNYKMSLATLLKDVYAASGISIEDLDFDHTKAALFSLGILPSFYTVYRTENEVNIPLGVVVCIGDANSHSITQLFLTTLVDINTSQMDHVDGKLQTWFRTKGDVSNPAYTQLSSWTPWEKFLADAEGDSDWRPVSQKCMTDSLETVRAQLVHPITVVDTDQAKLVIADENQHPLLTITNEGHIRTDLFDSSKATRAQRARIRHMHWNIGNFSKGANASSTVTAENFQLRKAQIIKEFDEYAPDVIAMCEWDNSFTTSVTARSALLSRFEYTAIGPTCSGYIGTCVAGSFPFISHKEISLPGGYTALEVTAVLCGMTIKIVECHCPWQSADLNLQAHQQLISRYGSEPRAIISGDFNIPSDSEQYFATLWDAAGFKMANWKDSTFRTGFKCLHGSWALDNCFVRGGSILAARAIQHTPVGISPDDPGVETFQQWAEVNASDHFPVITDIVFNP